MRHLEEKQHIIIFLVLVAVLFIGAMIHSELQKHPRPATEPIPQAAPVPKPSEGVAPETSNTAAINTQTKPRLRDRIKRWWESRDNQDK